MRRAGASPRLVDVVEPFTIPNPSILRTPRSGSRKKGGGRKFKLVSTRIGIRRSSNRRHRSSSRRSSSLSRRSSGLHGINASSYDVSTENRSKEEASRNKEGLPTFLQRKIPPAMRRSKSSKFSQEKENRPLLDMPSLMAQSSSLRNADVDLPFFMPPIESPHTIDLSTAGIEFNGAYVRPIHHSILGRNYCFEVVGDGTSRCFGCDSEGEREAWIEKIKRAINPNLDNSKRVEHQLTLCVQEAKGLPTKKKYFCEICLDRQLCARTTSKWKTDSSVFWGEHFKFLSMPRIHDVTVHLYKDSDKKKKKDKDYVGLVNLSVRSLISRQSLEKWYTLSTPSGNNKSKAGESMAIRIKAHYLSTPVLPSDQYKELGEHLSRHCLHIVSTLNNVIPVSRKDEIARILVHIMHGIGQLKDYMTDVVMEEVDKVEEESLLFRENTIATKSVESMLRMVGMKYLSDTLGDFILALFNMEEECEVDGSRLPPHASLETNQNNLHMSCEIALCKIVSSISIFPAELRDVMASWRMRCEENGRIRIANRLVTASLFLRLLCPAILNPNLFSLANEVPDAKVSRTLTLIAKVIQNLANRSRFGSKEEYMQFMDVFIREKWDDMGSFIASVSDPSLPPLNPGFHGFIDLSKEFAEFHAFFVELLPTLDQKTIQDLGDLPFILNQITESLEKPGETARNLPALLNLSDLAEDAVLSRDSDHLVLSGCKAPPHSFLPTVASSLLDLRDFVNAQESDEANIPPTCNFSPSHHGSHPSIKATSSYNNSNNVSNQRNRQALSSTENLLGDLLVETTTANRAPLMFSNPTCSVPYFSPNISSPTSLTEMHDSLPHRCTSGILKDRKKVPPLSFSNPIQELTCQQQLETVFTTETITYASPSNYVVGGYPGQISGDSSLSSRQSSTSSDTDDKSSSAPLASLQHRPTPSHKHGFASELPHGDHLFTDRLMSAESVAMPIFSAQLKCGLQISRPSPMPRSTLLLRDEMGRKVSMPALPARAVTDVGRRGSVGETGTTSGKCPHLCLAKSDRDVVMTLGEDNDKAKNDDCLVTTPVAAVKSRIVVSTSNANVKSVKTSKVDSPQHRVVTSNPVRRSSAYRKNPELSPQVPPQSGCVLPPSTPEIQLSPEARTAQWILNSVPMPTVDLKVDDEGMKGELTPKDYEDTIIRLEGEAERLRTRVSVGMETAKNLEQKEMLLTDKLRASERREAKLRRQNEEREEQMQKLLARMNAMEEERRRERNGYARERCKLEALMKSKDAKLVEQSKRIRKLERKVHSSNDPSRGSTTCEDDVINCIDSEFVKEKLSSHGGAQTSDQSQHRTSVSSPSSSV